jgi:hypothetical protein
VEYGLFSGFLNKFACRKKRPIDIFLIFCHDILAMILFRILTKSKGVHVLASSLNEIIIGSYCKKPDAIIFYRFEIVIFSVPL